MTLASREMVESATLEMATVFAPRWSASRWAAVVSAVSPDWVMTTTIGSASGVRGAIAIFAGVFDVHGDAGQIFHHDFAGEAGVAAGTAGGNDDFLKSEERVFDGLERIGKNHVVFDILTNGFANGVGLLVDFPQHVIGKLRWRNGAMARPAQRTSVPSSGG